jgi:hypothetical protein
VAYTVQEFGSATCIGGEGQLPFTVLPKERYPYADFVSVEGSRFATLEYDAGLSPRCFSGQVLEHHALTLDEEQEAAPSSSAHQGKHIRCPQCQAPLEINDELKHQTYVCAYCGAQNDLSGPEAKIMGINPAEVDPGFVFKIGQAAVFLGIRYEICGRLLYEDDEGYQTREYLLLHPNSGYLWLGEENGHYVLHRPTKQGPGKALFQMRPKQPITIGASEFKFYEAGTLRLVYVDGALPWLARSGDTNRYADLIAPPSMFSAEMSANEVEYFIGRYLSPDEVWQALDLKTPPLAALGVHPAQPYRQSQTSKAMMTLGGLFALGHLFLLLWSLTCSGRLIFNQSFSPDEYLQETVSKPFTIGQEKIIGLEVSAPLQNAWLAVEVALLDPQKNEVVAETDSELSYYQGIEEGERWSEGSRRTTNYFRAPPSGNYRLLLKGTAERESPLVPGGEALTVRLFQGCIISRYFLLALILTAVYPLYQLLKRYLFEFRRWSPVIGDNDDDDEDDD